MAGASTPAVRQIGAAEGAGVRSLSALGLDIVAASGSSQADVLRFVGRNPRPSRVAADPTATSDTRYGIEHSLWRTIKPVEHGRIVESCTLAMPATAFRWNTSNGSWHAA